VALVLADAAESFVAEVASRYEKASGLKPNIYVCRATNGAEVV
jgi:galactokinase